MPRWLRELAAFAEDWGPVPSTNTAAHKFVPPVSGDPALFPCSHCMHVCPTNMQTNILSLKLLKSCVTGTAR